MHIVESDFEYKGYRCIVIFTDMGHRCGYVGIPEGHPLYLVDEYDEEANLGMNFGVHGGITYTGGGHNSTHPVESSLWWIGFDCAHYDDTPDIKTLKKMWSGEWWGEDRVRFYMKQGACNNGTVRTKEYVEEECKKLVDQIVDWTEEHTTTPRSKSKKN